MDTDRNSLQSWELQPVAKNESGIPDSELLSPPAPSATKDPASTDQPQKQQQHPKESESTNSAATTIRTEHISKYPSHHADTARQTATIPPLNTNSLIAAAAAIALMTTGVCIGWSYYTKSESTRTNESVLIDSIAAIDDDIKIMAAKLVLGREKVEVLLPVAEKYGLLQQSIASKQEQIRKSQQLNAPVIEKIQNLQKAISTLEANLHKPNTPSSPFPSIPPIEGNNPPPIVDNRDQKTVQQSLAYLKARETGDIGTLSHMFGEQCIYQYAHDKITSNNFIMNDIKKFWDKWPKRTYTLLRVAHAENNIEVIYQYQCTNTSGKTIQGYTKETWKLSPDGRISSWHETLNRTAPPTPNPNYKSLKVEY